MNRALVDPASGDMFFYNFFKQKWEGIYNAGFHDLHRHDKMNGLEMEFEKNFQMYYKDQRQSNVDCNNILWEKMTFKKCLRSHFIRDGIEEGIRH